MGVRARRCARHGRWRALVHDGPLLTAVVLGGTLAFHVFSLIPATRDAAATLLHEDNVVEMTTFVALAVACVLAARLTLQLRRQGQPRVIWVFFALFALGLFVVAMEEISWGQWLFFWNTPESWKELNRQGETNLHNLPGLFGRSEWMRLTFAVGGLVGVLATRRPALKPLATPPELTGFFAIMTAYILLDLVDDLFDAPWVITTFSTMSEFVEMLIGIAAVCYFVLKREELVGPPLPGP
jgi:hypothetical protein